MEDKISKEADRMIEDSSDEEIVQEPEPEPEPEPEKKKVTKKVRKVKRNSSE